MKNKNLRLIYNMVSTTGKCFYIVYLNSFLYRTIPYMMTQHTSMLVDSIIKKILKVTSMYSITQIKKDRELSQSLRVIMSMDDVQNKQLIVKFI